MTEDIQTVTPIAHVERDTSEEDAQIVSDQEFPEGRGTVSGEKTTTELAEAVLWNYTPNNISVGLAVLNKDQFHVSIHRTCDIPKDLPTELAPGLVVIKPNEGMLFNLANTGPITVNESS